MLYVDDRRRGMHGIGRFARESVSHLTMPYRSLGARGNPARPLDVVNAARLPLRRSDTIYTPGFNAGLTRARQIVTVHDLIHLSSDEERSRVKTLYYERVVRPTVTRAGLVVTVSPTSAIAIAEWLDDDRVRIVDVGNGCAEVFFDPPPDDPETRPSSDGLRLLWVGSMKAHKRPETAMRLLGALPTATLTMVTNELDAVRSLAAAHGVPSDRIETVPECTDEQLRSLYVRSSCLLFPSQVEGFGLPVVEAIACRCPVLYWRGCTSVHDIADGIGVGLQTVEIDEWSSAVRALLPTRTTAPVDWAQRYSWRSVGTRLNTLLASETGR